MDRWKMQQEQNPEGLPGTWYRSQCVECLRVTPGPWSVSMEAARRERKVSHPCWVRCIDSQ